MTAGLGAHHVSIMNALSSGVTTATSQAERMDNTSMDMNHWSAGEMQLLALARAVLRRPLILVLDESCAHLDDTNSERIRDLLRYGDCFANTTVVVIAHRLTDIGACDRVL